MIYNFDYNNEKEIEKQLDKIDKEIAFCLQNYIINIKDGEEVKELLSKSVERERIARRVSTRENMIDVSEDDDWD